MPDAAQTALDVGTGDGLLASALRARVPYVTGLDLDPTALESARRRDPDVTWLQGDILTAPLPRGSFDVVASIATIHHLPDLDVALQRLVDLTAPGGVVAVAGLAQNSRPTDYAYKVAGVLQHQRLSCRHGYWEHSAQTAPPSHTYADVRRSAARVLPEARWQRLALWRYSLVWTKPTH